MRVPETYQITLATNVWSPHMVPIAEELYNEIGARFKMIVFEPLHDERERTGWSNIKIRPSWLEGPPRNRREHIKLRTACVEVDVLLMGHVPLDVMEERSRVKNLTLVIAERRIKQKWHALRMVLNPRYLRGVLKYRRIVNQPNWHCLAIGHYAPIDLHRLRLFNGKIWKWAYFVRLNPEIPAKHDYNKIKLLWVGRMLAWKRVDLVIKTVETVKTYPWFERCTIIGGGPLEGNLKRLARKLKLTPASIEFLDPVSIEAVRTVLREHDVLILSSDRNEGWGAIAAEAMSEGCIVVGNEEAGSVLDLINHGTSGFVFQNNQLESLQKCVVAVAENKSESRKIQLAAWKNVNQNWDPKTGATRLLALISDLINYKTSTRYSSGLCRNLSE